MKTDQKTDSAMSTPTPATARPWKVTPSGGITGDGEAIIVNDMTTLANFGGQPINDGFGKASANALLIVRAVNCHDELVEALANLLASVPFERLKGVDSVVEAIVAAAQTALAKAAGPEAGR